MSLDFYVFGVFMMALGAWAILLTSAFDHDDLEDRVRRLEEAASGDSVREPQRTAHTLNRVRMHEAEATEDRMFGDPARGECSGPLPGRSVTVVQEPGKTKFITEPAPERGEER